METAESLRQRVHREQQSVARLRMAATRFADAQTERTWAVVSAHQAGLSIRKIARATGLSSSRIHQLLNTIDAKEIPVWLSQLRAASSDEVAVPAAESQIRSRLTKEVAVLRRSIQWLQRLEHGEHVVVNLRPETDVETEFVQFDRPRVMRVLERIAADLDELGGVSNETDVGKEPYREDPRAGHRRDLAEPSPEPKKLTHREERAALGLPPR